MTTFIPTSQLLSSDGILVSRAHASTPEPTSSTAARQQAGGDQAMRGGVGGRVQSAAASRITNSAGGGIGSRSKAGGGGGAGVSGGLHDNYLTGRVIVNAAADPGDLHSLPNTNATTRGSSSASLFVNSALTTRFGQVTAAARSCSGELVEVPHIGGHKNNISATHPSVDGGSRYDRNFVLRGFVSPTTRTISDMHDAAIRGEVDAAQAAAAKAAQISAYVTKIQAIVRMRIERRRYLLHRERLTAVLERVFYERQMRCALLIQKCARRMVARYKYLRMRDALWQKQQNGGNKGRKGTGVGGSSGLTSGKSMFGASTSIAGGGARAAQNRRPSLSAPNADKKPAPLPQEPYPWFEGIAERNFTFVVALKAMIAGRLEEAKHAFETFSQQVGTGGDKVALRLAHCCDARLRTIANLANGGKPDKGGAGDKKGAGGKGGAKGKASPTKKR